MKDLWIGRIPQRPGFLGELTLSEMPRILRDAQADKRRAQNDNEIRCLGNF